MAQAVSLCYHSLSSIMHSLKGHTAREGNLLLDRTGAFWEHESYDHYVRDDKELERIVAYVLNNPVKAGLAADWKAWPWNYRRPASRHKLSACATARIRSTSWQLVPERPWRAGVHLILFNPRTDPERVAVGVAEVELADMPGLVRGRHRDGQPVLKGEGMRRIDFGPAAQPPAHPDTAGVVVAGVASARRATPGRPDRGKSRPRRSPRPRRSAARPNPTSSSSRVSRTRRSSLQCWKHLEWE